MISLFAMNRSALRLGIRTFFNTSLEPHSKQYLGLQLNLLKNINIKGEIQALAKGHSVIISNINASHLVRDIPAYDLESFHLLSKDEIDHLKRQCYEQGASLELAYLVNDVPCIKLKGEKGALIYYINRLKLHSKPGTLKTVDDFIENHISQLKRNLSP